MSSRQACSSVVDVNNIDSDDKPMFVVVVVVIIVVRATEARRTSDAYSRARSIEMCAYLTPPISARKPGEL